MKYAVKYYRGMRSLKTADEIIIKYNERNVNLIKFVQDYDEDKRIVANAYDLNNDDFIDNIGIFKAAAAAHQNFAVCCSMLHSYEELEEKHIKFFFNDFAGTFDEFTAIYNMGVSDIYITDELGFFLKDIKETVGKDVNIRVIPNMAQSAEPQYTDDFKKFFIRPEDLEEYEDYIDIVEFAGALDTQSVYCDIYKDGRWQGELEDIILYFHEHISNLTIVPQFGKARINCKRRCCFKKCNICDNVREAAEILRNKDLYFTKRKRVYESDSSEKPIEEIE